jgi:hypothetical protein
MLFDNRITEMFGSFDRFASEDAASGEIIRTKIEKGREFGKIFFSR